MSIVLDRGKYYVVTYWSREGRKRIREYFGIDKEGAYRRLIEVLDEKIKYWTDRKAEAQKTLK